MKEEWRLVPSLPIYEASSLGNLRRVSSACADGKPLQIKGTVFSNGYRYLQTTFGQPKGKRLAVGFHRLICEAFHGPSPFVGAIPRHLNGDPLNNVPENLAWGTAKENAADRRLHGRDLLGEKHRSARLVDEHEVIAIFVLRRRGLTGEEIADLFGMNRNSVNKVLARTAWAHVDVPESLLLGAAEAQQAYCGRAPRHAGRFLAGPLGARPLRAA
ncbi:HNH endonuclease signature motif containing protein [Methylobacterium nodulans]|uniref:HNH endonuclease n=1 Tax=Methylobacterium nodulans (strain LMG 21967 / CNCM I-2342 / ORS 2060) TaxID=460265 RepID=B8INW1_METNO|nr:HNH endonuclease signature motif containing protein [Methylobacterium nodulans]ACL58477.1 HNH endonuclease [Methylobacterium nodulans ORS 2060]